MNNKVIYSYELTDLELKELNDFVLIDNKQDLTKFVLGLREYTLRYIDNLTNFSKENWLVNRINGYMVYGGKMLRSLFFYILVLGMIKDCVTDRKRLNRDSWDKLFRLGAIFEMAHSATLVHDDILDGANTRRGKPAIHKKFGIDGAIIFGDILIISSLNEAYRVFPFYCKVLIECLKDMCLGEVLQYQNKYNLSISEEDYFKILFLKTGVLFGGIAKIAYHFATEFLNEEFKSELSEELFSLFSKYGVAFQIIDDLLDYRQDSRLLSKDSNNDILSGRVTYPLILLVNKNKELIDKWKRIWTKNPSYFLALVKSKIKENSYIYEQSFSKAKIFGRIDLLNNILDKTGFSKIFISLLENFINSLVDRLY